MRTFLAAAVLVIVPALAQAQDLRLRYPADANRDGVVTDDERADYAATKPVASLEIEMAAPRVSKPFLRLGRFPEPAGLGPVDRPAEPSEFLQAMDLKDRKDRQKDR